MSYYLVILGSNDNPIYETTLKSSKSGSSSSSPLPSPAAASVFGASHANSSNRNDNRQAVIDNSSGASFTSNVRDSIFGDSQLNSNMKNLSIANDQDQNEEDGSEVQIGYGPKTSKHVMQMVAHASLDVIEDIQWINGYMYFKNIDRFHEWNVSCWCTPGRTKLILLHDIRNDEGHRLFLHEIWESYVKVILNPFHTIDSPIRNDGGAFDSKVKSSARKYL